MAGELEGKKILFVFENIRFYEGEKSKDAEVRKEFRKDAEELHEEIRN